MLSKEARMGGLAENLATPETIRSLQRKLYEKAKRDRRHKVPGQGTRRFPAKEIFGPQGLISLGNLRRASLSNAIA